MGKTHNKFVINPLNAELNPICHLLVLLGDLTFMGPCIVSIFQYISNKIQRYTVYYIWKLLYMFRVVLPPEICRAVSRYNKLCSVASCWIYIGILLGAHYILHISRIRVNLTTLDCSSVARMLGTLKLGAILYPSTAARC
jgi:hypothetical protein